MVVWEAIKSKFYSPSPLLPIKKNKNKKLNLKIM